MPSSFTSSLVADLTRDEGLRLKPYVDSVGKLTIGYGRNLDDVGISEAEAQFLLANDIAAAETLLDRSIPWWRTLSEDRQRVLCNMAYNLGPRLLDFQTTLGRIQAGNYAAAAESMLQSKWAQQVGPRAVRLAALMRGTDPAVPGV
jgi:lysozyme